jgi:two-component system alkaline phosphatase synthesis response regulator PhoP
MMAGERILVVDDDEAIRTMLADIFREEGYEVQTANHGRQALDSINRSKFDLLLTDMAMPVMDGWELTRTLKERGISVPLVVMTAAQTAAALAREVDAVAYLGKPFDIETLLSTVDAVIHPTSRHS